MKNYTASIMKGIAIISVVLGHCTTNNNIESFVNQYHLAVFFFVSGFFLQRKIFRRSKKLFHKKVNSLIYTICHICNYFPYIS